MSQHVSVLEVWKNIYYLLWYKHYQVCCCVLKKAAFKMSLDEEENVIVRVLTSLTSLSELCLFQRMRLWELMSATLGFVYHPNIWIRQSRILFLSSDLFEFVR